MHNRPVVVRCTERVDCGSAVLFKVKLCAYKTKLRQSLAINKSAKEVKG